MTLWPRLMFIVMAIFASFVLGVAYGYDRPWGPKADEGYAWLAIVADIVILSLLACLDDEPDSRRDS